MNTTNPENLSQGIIRNSSAIIVGNFINKGISLLILVYLTHYLSVTDFGRYSFVIFYITFLGIFTDFGLNSVLVRESSRRPEQAPDYFGMGILIKLAFTFLSAMVACIMIALMGYPAEIRMLVYIASIMLFISFRGIFFRQVFEVPFQVQLKMVYPSVINVSNELLTLGVLIGMIVMKATLTHIILAMTLINLPGFMVVAYLSKRLIRPRFKMRWNLCRHLMKEACPVGVAGFLENLFILTPVMILSKLGPEEALGHYALAFRLSSSLWILPVAFMMSLFPVMSQYSQYPSIRELKASFLSGLKYMTLLGIPIALIVSAFAHPIIRVISGESYDSAAATLQILIWGTAIYFMITVFFYTLNASNLQRINYIAWSVIASLALGLSLVLTSYWGQVGAAIAVMVSLLAGLFTYLYITIKTMMINPVYLLLKCILAGIFAGLIMIATKEHFIVFGSILALTVYFLALFTLNVLTREDFATFRKWCVRSA